ncbi:DUF2058 family protein [Thiothrix fructosivorans]|jgi:uncharacterized protein YaiL (DUF2058 family)|uniref:DUF2058 family protein n=1 Tax=Thiothrix fructosivorans TaxID=111770 RepID=A0A8B0SN41_9GAMM|nr:DUF2058 family protein [Thiothrix fructosivorans]MBO0614077.1 DUF2058 family protein [Thiothrix fructosivorans]QTX12565.1 DUF2058 family protein [Thiothrix fructosivorans]
MAHSLRDQLLKAGLVTEAQVEKANQPKPTNPRPQQAKPKPPRRDNRPAAAPPQREIPQNQAPRPIAKEKKEKSDLAQFYEARAKTEREERQQAEQRQREIAERRKQTRAQVATLINDNLHNVDDADIRYNFVVGDNIKYLYVTEAQQQALADGKLAITFLGGKRCLIPAEIAQQILALDPDKLIVINTADDELLTPAPAPACTTDS